MSTIVTDTLQGKTSATSITLPTTTNIGSTPLVSASANSMTIRGEGSAVTNIQQGLCKAWSMYNHSTEATLDSFNQSSATDTSTGVFTWATTNNFASVNWVAASNLHADNANNDVSMVHSGTRSTNGAATDKATTGSSWYAKNSSNSGFDSKLAGYMAFGDLA